MSERNNQPAWVNAFWDWHAKIVEALLASNITYISTNVVIGSGGDTQTVIVKNSRAGTLLIEKKDSLTNEPLKGVTFKVTTADGEFVPDESGRISSNGLYNTDANGQIKISGG